ncbi:ORC-CDC6 family AAA ATPase [Psychrobacter fjordensis]|uniref:ORC-CDC6 family AAA ATPase n=1 Tax=Psychrobacter fjordensis TaxID=664424 RepID=UPI0019186B55|nr:hypothetical protein [Psychrobacter fjordensis]
MKNSRLIQNNPFTVSTPEILTAQDIVDLFVPYPEFSKLESSGHQFLDGHRGSGKSMMLRMLCPDCQSIVKSGIEKIQYFGVYIGIKKTNLNNPEYKRIEKEIGGTIIAESLLTVTVLISLFNRLSCYINSQKNFNKDLITSFFDSCIKPNLVSSGYDEEIKINDNYSAHEQLVQIESIFNKIFLDTNTYIKKRAFSKEYHNFDGILLSFQDNIIPIVSKILEFKIIPDDIAFYLLFDDADNLSDQQTRVLNSWISYRSTNLISLKVSTQLRYKTYKTVSDIRIQSPHDFYKIEFTTNRTGSLGGDYSVFLEKIVNKRLAIAAIPTKAKDFFPDDMNQEEKIAKIAQEFRDQFAENGKGYRASDQAYREARPQYIKQLVESRHGNDYKYAGFSQLTHISSGIVRSFLEPAANMYAEQALLDNLVTTIPPSLQDKIIREEADRLYKDLETLAYDDEEEADKSNFIKLKNLIDGVGRVFYSHIIDDSSSQRRLNSFTVSGELSENLKTILALGESHGYFYTDTRGARSGFGRQTRYVLTKRLAPMYKLDPNGYSGDKSLSSTILEKLMLDPKAYESKLRKDGVIAVDSKNIQPSLFIGD